jgi:uncharacterized protein (DUF1330 family)
LKPNAPGERVSTFANELSVVSRLDLIQALCGIRNYWNWKIPMSQPLLVLVQFNVKDFPKYFEQYGSLMRAEVEKYGGQFLAASRDVVVQEGQSSGNFTAIIRFPSKEAATAMYESAGYAPLKAKRIGELTDGGNVIFIPGLEAAPTS